jgi:hypothetical protein
MLGDRIILRMRGLLPLLLVLGCASPAAGEGELRYREAIESIVSDAGVFINFDMIDDPRLEYFFGRPSEFEAQARRLIADAHASLQERRVALISMQCLPLTRYLDLLRFISRLEPTDENRILTHHAILPGFQWSTRIALGFKDASVRSALRDVLESPIVDNDLKRAIGEVLSGTTATYIRERNERPRWQCSSEE